jgi:hypothetical protein
MRQIAPMWLPNAVKSRLFLAASTPRRSLWSRAPDDSDRLRSGNVVEAREFGNPDPRRRFAFA